MLYKYMFILFRSIIYKKDCKFVYASETYGCRKIHLFADKASFITYFFYISKNRVTLVALFHLHVKIKKKLFRARLGSLSLSL